MKEVSLKGYMLYYAIYIYDILQKSKIQGGKQRLLGVKFWERLIKNRQHEIK